MTRQENPALQAIPTPAPSVAGDVPQTVYFRALDFYRFLAALGVVQFHYLGLVGLKAEPNLRHLVDFFFILSGFVMMHTYFQLRRREIAGFIVRRFARIYPLHLATLLFFIAYGLVRSHGGADPSAQYAPSAIVPNLLMIHAWNTTDSGTFNFPSWSISSEWFVYLCFPGFLWLYRRLGRGSLLLAAAMAIAAALSIYDHYTGGRSWTLRTYDWGAVRAVPTFLSGMALRAMKLPRVSWPVVYLAGLLYIGLYAFPIPDEFFVVASGAMIALTAGAKGTSFLESPRLKILSDASYGIYMIHMCVGALVLNVAGERLHLLPPAVLLVLANLAALMLAVLSFHYFEKPARDWLRALLERPARSMRPV